MGNCEQCGQELPEDFFTELVFQCPQCKTKYAEGSKCPKCEWTGKLIKRVTLEEKNGLKNPDYKEQS